MKKAIPKTVQLGFLCGVCVLVLSAFLPYHNAQLLKVSERWIDHTLEVLQLANELRIVVTDAESGQRGFLLTQNPDYLEPYESARKKISQQLETLTLLTADNPAQLINLTKLKELTSSKFAELQTTIDLQNQSRRDEALKLVGTDFGNNLMHNIRITLQDFQAGERELLDERVADTRKRLQETLFSFLFMTFLDALLFAGLYLFIIKNFLIRRVAEISLRRQSTLMKSVVHSMSEGLYVIDTKGVTLLHNPVLAKIYGKQVAEFGPNDWQREYKITDLDAVPFKFENFPAVAVLNGQPEAIAEMVIISLDSNETKILKVTARPLLDEAGVLEGVVCISSDVSQQKRVELKLRNATAQAELANKAKSNFVANMSHEIRTPMNAVMGMAQLLQKTGLTNGQKKYLDMILLSSKSLMNILNDILDFSKIEADKIELASVQFRLSDVVQPLSPIMSTAAAKKNIELIIDTQFTDSPLLMGDSHRLHQILVNLVSNAIKFTDSGEVALIINYEKSNDEQVTIRFTVRDTGVGMSQVQQDRLFSPFTQADASITRQFGGTGLGLTIARRLTELMGGHLDMKSTLGLGSEFSACIPFTVCKDAECRTFPTHSLDDFRLLVIDDNDSARNAIANHILTWRWKADMAASIEDGLKLLHEAQSLNHQYDAILLDWRIQEADPIGLIKQIRALLKNTTPIVVMLSMHDRENISDTELVGKEFDPVRFILKPTTVSSLFDTLNEFFVPPQNEVSHVEESNAEAQVLKNVRVLLVEDNEFNQIVARDLLEHLGAIVDLVENGQSAVDVLLSNVKHYDVILMDVQMPVMDGFTATRIIRQSNIHTPIIAMTAGVTEFERESCMESGMNDLIAKPIEVEKMLSTIGLYTSVHEQGTKHEALPGIHLASCSGQVNLATI
ncbi:MAG: CHASE3 domain-containing protein [Pseudomonadota bacterium]